MTKKELIEMLEPFDNESEIDLQLISYNYLDMQSSSVIGKIKDVFVFNEKLYLRGRIY